MPIHIDNNAFLELKQFLRQPGLAPYDVRNDRQAPWASGFSDSMNMRCHLEVPFTISLTHAFVQVERMI